jgi:hypothetical protein
MAGRRITAEQHIKGLQIPLVWGMYGLVDIQFVAAERSHLARDCEVTSQVRTSVI